MDSEYLSYFSKQIALPNVGQEGQSKIRSSSVLVVGAGALGSSVVLNLVSAGIGEIGVCDGDVIEKTNLHRQVLYSHDAVGRYKVDMLFDLLHQKYPFSCITPITTMLEYNNIESIIGNFNLVVDCTDNYTTKMLLHDYCCTNSINYIQGGLYQYDGIVYTFKFSDTTSRVGCLRCLKSSSPDFLSSSTSKKGVISPVPNLIAAIQSLEALKLLLGDMQFTNIGYVVSTRNGYNITEVHWSWNDRCCLCGR